MLWIKLKVTDYIAYFFAALFAFALGSRFFSAGRNESLFWLISLFEIVIIFLLLNPKTVFAGLYFACSWFILFTFYILTALHASLSVPCSCNYLWFNMSWNTQLMVNVGCILVAMTAILFKTKFNPLILCALMSIYFCNLLQL